MRISTSEKTYPKELRTVSRCELSQVYWGGGGARGWEAMSRCEVWASASKGAGTNQPGLKWNLP